MVFGELSTFCIEVSLVTLVISPFASALFNIQNIIVPSENIAITRQSNLGLTDSYATLTPFVYASGFVLAKDTFGLDWLPFVDENGEYPAIARCAIEDSWGINGKVYADSVAVKMSSNCEDATSIVTSQISADLTVALTSASCTKASFNYTVLDQSSPATYIGALPECAPTVTDAEYLPVAFVHFVNNVPTASICTPTMQVLNVHVGVDLGNQTVLDSTSNGTLAEASNPLLSAPLYGNAFNGIVVNSSTTITPLLSERILVTVTNLGSTVEQRLASQGTANLTAIINDIYSTYLTVLASVVLFIPEESESVGSAYPIRKQLTITTYATHILCAAFSFYQMLALVGGWLMWAHAKARRNACFTMPGKGLAGAVSVAGELVHLLDVCPFSSMSIQVIWLT
ncbi:hypothetical protein P7C70_g1944, partial [Phenoliferia sp. Uapishka_3]